MKLAPETLSRILRFALLVSALVASVVLAVTHAISEQNATRIIVAVVALVVTEIRRTPPPAALAVLAALGAGELGASAIDAGSALAMLGAP